MGWRRPRDNEHSRVQPCRNGEPALHRLGLLVLGYCRCRCTGAKMEFTALFLATVIVMLAAWRGSRPLALGLFAAVLIASVATYLHHATDTLKLSF
jgi:Family of unknown function (DUF5993)